MCPAAKKQRSPKTARNTLYLFVPSVAKKSLFFYQKSNAPHLNIFFLCYIPWLIQKHNNPLTLPHNKPLTLPLNGPVDTTKQVTSPAPAKIIKQKNPKRVAAGKAIAEKTKLAREVQKQKAAEAEMIIAKDQLKKAEAAAGPPAAEPANDTSPAKNVLTTTQWLSVISIFISVVGIYYKREEIKKVLTKNPPQAPPPSPVDAASQRKGGIRPMD